MKSIERNIKVSHEFIKRKKVCELLGISNVTLWRMERNGKIKPTGYVGKRPRYTTRDIADCLEQNIKELN